MNRVAQTFKQLAQYPSAVAGILFIVLFIALAVYAMATMPFSEAVELWRGTGDTWQYTPRNAAPAWLNMLPGINRPVTMDFDTRTRPRAAPSKKWRRACGKSSFRFRLILHTTNFRRKSTSLPK